MLYYLYGATTYMNSIMLLSKRRYIMKVNEKVVLEVLALAAQVVNAVRDVLVAKYSN